MPVNTSFNVRDEPIVCTPEDAFRCFMGNELDLLVVGNCVLRKAEQNPALRQGLQLGIRTRLADDDCFLMVNAAQISRAKLA